MTQTTTADGVITWRTVGKGAIAALLVGFFTLVLALSFKGLLFPESLAPVGDVHLHGTPGPFFVDVLKSYTPRRICMFQEPAVIWLHFVSDLIIAIAYFSIPVALVYFVRRRSDLTFSWMFWMFAAFIMLCGTTHVFGVWALWQPVYKLDGIVKAVTGIVSLATAVLLWPLIPRALAIPSPSMLEQRVRERTAELALAKEERELALERLRLSQVASRIVSWDWDVESGRVAWSGPGEKVYGYPLDSGPDFEHFAKFVHPDDRADFDRALADAMNGAGLYKLEFRYVWPDGSLHWLLGQGTVFFDEDRRPNRMVGINKEITEQKQYEGALRESEQRYRALVDASSDVVYRMSPDWIELRRLDGREFIPDTHEPSSSWVEKYILPEDREQVLAVIAEAIRARSIFQLEHRVWRVDGSAGWIFSRAIPILDVKGEIVEWFGAASDVTRRREAEEALRKADRKKDEFIATLAHELRNPLAPILNAVHILKQFGPPAEPLEKALGMIGRQVQHMARLIDDLLDVSRITQGKLELRKERVRLDAILNSALEVSMPLIRTGQHDLTTDYPQQPIYLYADPIRAAQIFSNLLNNASKYTSPGGRVWLAAARRDNEVAVSVRDNGSGIAQEHMPRLFQMFSQVKTEHGQRGGGLGIGLALVRGLVEMHAGTVEVRSEGLGKGSEFIVRLPISEHEDQQPQKAGVREKEAAPFCSRRILVVDDNRDSADSLALLLQSMGHEVQTAYDGVEALDTMRGFSPQLILLDIGMPRMNGYEAARRIRDLPDGEKLMLVAMTGWGQEEDKRRAEEAGFNRHLTKPVDPELLDELLAQLGASA